MFQFDCPCCPLNGRIISESAKGLTTQIHDHILEHERIAGRKAVDAALRQCRSVNDCHGGHFKVWSAKEIKYEEKLTAYDLSFLASMGISYEQPVREPN